MALVFVRRLVIALWAMAFFMVAFTAPPPAVLFLMPPTTLFVIAVVGAVLVVFTILRPIPWLRASRSLVPVLPSRHRDKTNGTIAMTAGVGVGRLEEPRRRTADDALDSARMDDDGALQSLDPSTERLDGTR